MSMKMHACCHKMSKSRLTWNLFRFRFNLKLISLKCDVTFLKLVVQSCNKIRLW